MPTEFANSQTKKQTKASIREQTIGDVLSRVSGNTKGVQKEKSDLPKSTESAFEKKTINTEIIRPPRSTDIYRIEGDGKEAEYERLTDKGIKDLYGLVSKFKNSPNRGELWVRLAEAYVEKARLVKYRKYREHEQKLDDFDAKKTKVKPVLDLREAREYNQQAVNLYKLFLNDFPKDKKVGQVLFFLGYNYYELGREDEGAKYYKILADKYTKSAYLDESTFSLGDYYFEKNRWKDALKYYSRLLDKKEGRHYLLALYKTAWCKYRLSDARQALRGMELVYLESRRQKEEGERGAKISKVRLASEALRDIVPFYSEIGDYRNAENYFERLVGAGKSANRMMERLAYIYSSRGNIEAARLLFKRLIEIEPLAPKSFEYQYQVVVNYSSAGKGNTFKSELYDWIVKYAPGSEWSNANKKDDKLLTEAYERREKTLRNYVLQEHQAVKKSGNEDARRRTLEWYKVYLRSFSESKEVSDMHFFHGELLYDNKMYAEASQEYNWVLVNDQKSKYYKDANINVIASLEKLLPSQQTLLTRRDKLGKSNEPIAMDSQLSQFVNVAQNFITKYPTDPRSSDLQFKVAQVYYLHNMFKESIDNFEPIIKKSPKSQAGQDAISFVLDIYNRRQDFVGLKKVSEILLANNDIRGSAAGKQLQQILVNTKFKNAEQLLKSNQSYASGEAFEKFATENPNSSLAVSAVYNAAFSYKQAHAVGPALKMYEALLNHPDKSAEAQRLKAGAAKELPPLYQQLGNYIRAAKGYESAAAANPKEAFAKDYLFNAAVIWDGFEYYDNAIRDYQAYAGKETKGSDRIEANYYQAEIWRKRGNAKLAIENYEKYVNGPAANKERIVESCFKIYELYLKANDMPKANRWRDKTISVQRSLSTADKSIGAKYAAEARFVQLKEIYEQIRKISIPANAKTQGVAIKQRLALIEKLKTEIVQVLRYASGHQIVASYTTLAMAYGNTAYAIKTAPLPAEIKALKKEQIAQYEAKVAETYVVPLDQKAFENYELAVQNANQLDVYDDYVVNAKKNLARMNPQFSFVNAKLKTSNFIDTMGL